MRWNLVLTPMILATIASPAAAQSSNTSSNSSSNNGVVRERVVDTYRDRGMCERTVSHRVYRDDGGNNRRDRWRERREREYRQRYERDDDD